VFGTPVATVFVPALDVVSFHPAIERGLRDTEVMGDPGEWLFPSTSEFNRSSFELR
jgi:hypothetical protein